MAISLSIIFPLSGDGEHFRKLQAHTIVDGNVFAITFTSQQALFPVYLSAVYRMVESFEQM